MYGLIPTVLLVQDLRVGYNQSYHVPHSLSMHPPSVPITPSSTLVSHFLSAVVVIIAPKGLKLDITRRSITPSTALDSWVVDLWTDQHMHGG